MRALIALLLAAPSLVNLASAETVTLVADRDATLFEDSAGLLASGAGADLYVGRTAQKAGSKRRALLRFDLGAIPKHARIESVRLVLHVTQASSAPSEIRLHRLLGDWGEGASASTGGSGAPSALGDATWIHRRFDPANPAPPPPPAAPANPRSSHDGRWQSAGADFEPGIRAARTITSIGAQSWEDPALSADVEHWLQHPKANFGWVLIGGEETASTVRKFGSRQNVLPDYHPRLHIRYSLR